MAEVVIDVDIERRRRLPAWMLKPAAGKDQRKSENGDEKASVLEERQIAQATGAKLKSISRKLDSKTLPLEILESVGKSDPKCEVRKVAKWNGGHRSSFGSCCQSDEVKKKFKKELGGCGTISHERVVPRKQKLKAGRLRDTEAGFHSPGSREDEVDLSVEDLRSIAQKFINANRENQSTMLTTGKPDSELNLQSSSKYLKFASGEYLATTVTRNQALSKCSHSSSQVLANDMEEEKAPATESGSSSFTGTGDAANDMLDLFLGPLLKKKPSEDRDAVRDRTKDIILEQKSNNEIRSWELRKEDGPVEKRKGSLKDRVAMFLV